MKRYISERDIPGIGGSTSQQLEQAATKSNAALTKLQGRAQWVHSYVAGNKTFCIYLAEDEAAVREHAQVSGFRANKITETPTIIDPVTAGQSRACRRNRAGGTASGESGWACSM